MNTAGVRLLPHQPSLPPPRTCFSFLALCGLDLAYKSGRISDHNKMVLRYAHLAGDHLRGAAGNIITNSLRCAAQPEAQAKEVNR